jgi:nucleotide-binding universal stress UspA family protein
MQEHLHTAAETGDAFARWAATHGVRHTAWRVVQGGYHGTLANESAWSDLIVLRRADDDPRADVATVGIAVLNGGTPTLIVPDNVPNAEFAHVAIAWNGRVEGTRAVQSALPLLRRAKRVTLLLGQRVDPNEVRAWTPARELEQHLATHGIRVETRTIDAEPDEAGNAILEAVTDCGADLLVMGAFGRSRFAEWILGGATRQVLENTRVAVLMRH